MPNPPTQPSPTVVRQLFERLAETAAKLHRDNTLTGYEIATAFLSVGTEMARTEYGAVQAAEWLRDIADGIEASALTGRKR